MSARLIKRLAHLEKIRQRKMKKTKCLKKVDRHGRQNPDK